MPRTADLGLTTYWWIPGVNGIADPDAISAAVLTSAKNISPYVVTTTSINPTSSDTISEKGITDTANSTVPLIGNYEGNLVLFRDLTAGAPTATDPLTTIGKTAGIVGWIVRRTGFPTTTAAATGQFVDAFLFATDTPSKSGGQADGFLKVTIPLLAQGAFRIETALVA